MYRVVILCAVAVYLTFELFTVDTENYISKAIIVLHRQPKRNQTDSYEESYHGAESDSSTESARFFGGIRGMILVQNHDTILFQNHGDSLMESGKFSPRFTCINIFISDRWEFFWNSFPESISFFVFSSWKAPCVLFRDLFL